MVYSRHVKFHNISEILCADALKLCPIPVNVWLRSSDGYGSASSGINATFINLSGHAPISESSLQPKDISVPCHIDTARDWNKPYQESILHQADVDEMGSFSFSMISTHHKNVHGSTVRILDSDHISDIVQTLNVRQAERRGRVMRNMNMFL